MSNSPALQESALEEAGAVVSRTSLKFATPESLTWEAFEKVGEFLGTLGKAYCWWVGDFLIYGEDIFGEEFAQIEERLPHSQQTLINYRSIAHHVPPTRRRQSLSFSVHAEVAYLEPRVRDRLLDMAEEHGWKREQMRAAVRGVRELGSVDDPVVTGTAAHSEVTPGEPVPGPEHRCPNCGHTWKENP